MRYRISIPYGTVRNAAGTFVKADLASVTLPRLQERRKANAR